MLVCIKDRELWYRGARQRDNMLFKGSSMKFMLQKPGGFGNWVRQDLLLCYYICSDH